MAVVESDISARSIGLLNATSDEIMVNADRVNDVHPEARRF
jgi:hypothetical protein